MIHESARYFHDIWSNNKVKEAKKYPEFFEYDDSFVAYRNELTGPYGGNVFDYMAEVVKRRRVESLNDLLEEP